MSEAVDPFDAPIVSAAEKLGWSREQAIAFGREYGKAEAAWRSEESDWSQSRIKRAMAYAAWEYDGKPIGEGTSYRKEFGIPEPAMSDPRVQLGGDFKGKK